ncbi:MAG: hypothetical protein KJ670_17540 [Alphaproteobacteria bacterium]|jgi:L-lactate dehydrogenase (cytochrome)|nr:hypothetical protein [Rhizobiaceae bacterium]MBU3960122.1 hypothetical protein [Alphaproteobacteria bacterium]MBU4051129.1 hypothetical protein [Alphaproteobacteria bacterium]MBU4090515.1 hypothetical protein [Alphaproteobacteria bacterium]MBU4155885.1 hypothetical protein [Alphaproteobacteria bacterium]
MQAETEVPVEGGIRIGRALLRIAGTWGASWPHRQAVRLRLSALGEAAVSRLPPYHHGELDIMMALCGVKHIDAADTSSLTAAEKLLRRNWNLGSFRSRQFLSV